MQIDVDPDQDFHVVINGAVTALSLDGLDAAYQADSISDETLIWQEGLQDWMRLDTLLAALGAQESELEEAPPAPEPAVEPGEPAVDATTNDATTNDASTNDASTNDANTFAVLVAPDDQRSMTLEALADAYRMGVVSDQTLVWKAGQSDWIPLSVVIAQFANPQSAPPPSQAPTQRGGPAPSQAPTVRAAPTPGAAPTPSAAVAPHSAPSVAAPSAPAPSMNSLVPTAASIAPPAPGMGLGASTPSAMDDLEFGDLKGSGSTWLKRSLMGAGALAAVCVVYLGTRDSSGEDAVPLAVAPNVAAAAAPEVEAEPSAWEKEQELVEKARLKDEAAAKAAAEADDSEASAFGAALTGQPQPKKAAPVRSNSKWKPKAKKTSPSKNSGSNQYDPMNGAL